MKLKILQHAHQPAKLRQDIRHAGRSVDPLIKFIVVGFLLTHGVLQKCGKFSVWSNYQGSQPSGRPARLSFTNFSSINHLTASVIVPANLLMCGGQP